MTIQDLRTTLHERAAGVHDDAVAGRAEAARRRARGIRRQQTLVVLAAAAVVVSLIGAAILGGNPLKRTAPVVEVPEHDPAVVEAFAGRDLLDSRVQRGGAEVTLTSAAEVPTQWTATCFGVGAEFTLHMTLDGGSPGEAPCEAAEPPEPLMGYVLDDRFPPGPHTLHLWLARSDGSAVSGAPAAVLAAGVYVLPDSITDVAGVAVYERERVFDPSTTTLREWEYVDSQESQPGDGRLLAAHQADIRTLAQIVAPTVSPDDVRLLVDGVEADAASVLNGSGFVGPLTAGRHTVELRIRGGTDPSAQLGVVWREAAP
jgi:hypothetical protein